MRAFEFTFEVAEMTEATEDAVVAGLDAVVAIHHGVTTVTVLVTGPDCLSAARKAVETLRRLDALPLRLVDDLVTRGQIAERSGVTRQAVGQWIRGERHPDNTFPPPLVLAGGGLWLWGEVVQALAARGVDVDQDIAFPGRRDSQLIGGMLVAESPAFPWSDGIDTGRRFSVTPGMDPGSVFVPAPDSVRGDFALSA